MNLHICVKILLYWYIFIFFSTEILSYLQILERKYILPGELFFWIIILFFLRKEILYSLKSINFKSKSTLIILVLSVLIFIQGLFSAPSTTDSMVYHLPRVMYWIQNKTVLQDVIRNPHDFMAPFAEYILLHLYLITGNDQLLFFSQWIAFVMIVIISGAIAERLGADKQIKIMVTLFVATLPMAVMQASSTQVDLVVAVLVVLSTYIALELCRKITINVASLFWISLGLGITTKATFFLFMVIPAGIMIFALIKKHWKDIFIFALSSLAILIIPFRFMNQNLYLYGNILGPFKKGETLTNEVVNLTVLISNLIRNIMIHLPIPFFTTQAQNLLEFIHRIIGIPISAQETTCCDFQFRVIPILYPQEDIVSNFFHLLLIMFTIVFIFKKAVFKDRLLFLLFILSLFSFIIFSLILKWQPFHSRLQIPFFVIGTISAVMILSKNKKNFYILKGVLLSSILLAFLLIFLNVSRPFISYNLFYNNIKSFSFPLSSIPQSFFLKLREEQYFNARFYWYFPYKNIIEVLAVQNSIKDGTVAFDLLDGFEYPLWLLIKKYKINSSIIPLSKISNNTIIISTSKNPYIKEGYITKCIKTEIEYGYGCLSKAK